MVFSARCNSTVILFLSASVLNCVAIVLSRSKKHWWFSTQLVNFDTIFLVGYSPLLMLSNHYDFKCVLGEYLNLFKESAFQILRKKSSDVNLLLNLRTTGLKKRYVWLYCRKKIKERLQFRFFSWSGSNICNIYVARLWKFLFLPSQKIADIDVKFIMKSHHIGTN